MLQNVTRPDGSIVSFKYDALGRRIEKKYKKTIFAFVGMSLNLPTRPLHNFAFVGMSLNLPIRPLHNYRAAVVFAFVGMSLNLPIRPLHNYRAAVVGMQRRQGCQAYQQLVERLHKK